MTVEVGQILEGTVVKIAPFGAFVKLDTGEVGLIHISEIDRGFVRDVREHLHEDDRVRVKVLSVKADGKIDLSLKQAEEGYEPEPPRRGRDPEFERKLKAFRRESEQRLVDVRRRLRPKKS